MRQNKFTTERKADPFHIQPLEEINKYDALQEKQRFPIPNFEIIWIITGGGKLTVDLYQYTLAGSCIYFLSPGQLRQIKADRELRGYYLSLSGNFYFSTLGRVDYTFLSDRFTPGKNITIFKPGPEKMAILNAIISLTAKEYALNAFAHPDILSSFLRTFMLYLSQEQATIIHHHGDKEAEEKVRDFLLLVQQNFLKKKMVADYASEMAISSGYLNHIVKKISGFSPRYHIQQCIILEAKRRIFLEKMRLKEVATYLGFDDSAHFSRYFKNKCGVNFTSYKNSLLLKAEQ